MPPLDSETLRTLAIAADYMASESTADDRGGRCAAYLRRAADSARAAAGREISQDDARAAAGIVRMWAGYTATRAGITGPAVRNMRELADRLDGRTE